MEARLLSSLLQQQQDGEDEEEGGSRVLYRATFKEREEAVIRYESAYWVLLSLVLLLAWGAGLLMLLYLPFRRYAVRKDVQSRRLYITTSAIVYKVEKPIFLPCFGVNRREKHILLSLVTDVAIEQGCLQSAYNVHSIKIENASRRKPPPGDDLQIVGVDNPKHFRKMVLKASTNLRRGRENPKVDGVRKSLNTSQKDDDETYNVPERTSSLNWTWQQGTGLSSWQMSYSPMAEAPHENRFAVSEDLIFQKLNDIGQSMKRIEVLIDPTQI